MAARRDRDAGGGHVRRRSRAGGDPARSHHGHGRDRGRPARPVRRRRPRRHGAAAGVRRVPLRRDDAVPRRDRPVHAHPPDPTQRGGARARGDRRGRGGPRARDPQRRPAPPGPAPRRPPAGRVRRPRDGLARRLGDAAGHHADGRRPRRHPPDDQTGRALRPRPGDRAEPHAGRTTRPARGLAGGRRGRDRGAADPPGRPGPLRAAGVVGLRGRRRRPAGARDHHPRVAAGHRRRAGDRGRGPGVLRGARPARSPGADRRGGPAGGGHPGDRPGDRLDLGRRGGRVPARGVPRAPSAVVAGAAAPRGARRGRCPGPLRAAAGDVLGRGPDQLADALGQPEPLLPARAGRLPLPARGPARLRAARAGDVARRDLPRVRLPRAAVGRRRPAAAGIRLALARRPAHRA